MSFEKEKYHSNRQTYRNVWSFHEKLLVSFTSDLINAVNLCQNMLGVELNLFCSKYFQNIVTTKIGNLQKVNRRHVVPLLLFSLVPFRKKGSLRIIVMLPHQIVYISMLRLSALYLIENLIDETFWGKNVDSSRFNALFLSCNEIRKNFFMLDKEIQS